MDGLSGERDSVTGCDRSQVVTAGAEGGLTRDRTGGNRCSAVPHLSRATSRPSLSFTMRQSDALVIYAKLVEAMTRTTSGYGHASASLKLQKSRGVLTLPERAVVELAYVAGRSLTTVSLSTGRTVEVLAELLMSAGDKLADLYSDMAQRDR